MLNFMVALVKLILGGGINAGMEVPYSRTKLRKPMIYARLAASVKQGVMLEYMPGSPIEEANRISAAFKVNPPGRVISKPQPKS